MEQLSIKINSLSSSKLQEFLEEKSLEKLHKLKLYLDDIYYNTGESSVEDWRYDMLKDTLRRRDPDYVPPVGAKLREGENRVNLPYFLGSADKITPDEPRVLERWIRDNPAKKIVISVKLDGVSCLLACKNGRVKLFTRGDGVIGADISYLAPYFSTIPDLTGKTINVRGELIMKKETFERKYKNKKVNNRTYKNARNMVAGLIGGKTVRKGLKDVDFVCYEVVGDNMPRPSKQFKKLDKLGFKTARHTLVKDISIANLSDLYLRFKRESEYEIDGIIVQSNVQYDRNTSGNPSYLFAFKMLVASNIHTTTVEEVEWNVSKWGQLKPVVIVDPVELNDITISRATAHNAKYIEENVIGPGAIIRVTRSKEVIPYIVEIVKQADKPAMPDVDYKWDKNHVNILVVEPNDIMCIKLIAGFFAKLGIKHVSEATVKRMYENGLTNLLKIIGASKGRLAQLPRFKEGMVKRTYNNIHNGLQDVKLSLVLGASGIFGNGIGRKRMDMLLLDIPNLLTLYKTISRAGLKQRVMQVEGFSDIMADKIVNNIEWADKFIQKIGKYATFKEEVRVSDTLRGKKFVMTGFRDKGLENDITERGGKITGSVSKNTTALVVVKKGGKLTGKSKKASELGIPIYEKEKFVEKFIV